MKTIICLSLLMSVSLMAQDSPTAPATQNNTPAAPQMDTSNPSLLQGYDWKGLFARAGYAQDKTRTPDSPALDPAQNVPVDPAVEAEARKKLQELGYFKDPIIKWATPPLPTCAIPLLQGPAPDPERFAARNLQPGNSSDPKIVVEPRVPACPPKTEGRIIRREVPVPTN